MNKRPSHDLSLRQRSPAYRTYRHHHRRHLPPPPVGKRALNPGTSGYGHVLQPANQRQESGRVTRRACPGRRWNPLGESLRQRWGMCTGVTTHKFKISFMILLIWGHWVAAVSRDTRRCRHYDNCRCEIPSDLLFFMRTRKADVLLKVWTRDHRTVMHQIDGTIRRPLLKYLKYVNHIECAVKNNLKSPDFRNGK